MKAVRIVIAFCAVIAAGLRSLAGEGFDVLRSGEQVERFTVPAFECPANSNLCVGLEYVLQLNKQTCLRYAIADVRVADGGVPVPFDVVEYGEPGMPGYRLVLHTDWRFSGEIAVRLVVSRIASCGFPA